MDTEAADCYPLAVNITVYGSKDRLCDGYSGLIAKAFSPIERAGRRKCYWVESFYLFRI